MTKTARIASARSIRAHLAQFSSFQSGHMQRFIRREWNRDPDYAAFSQLLMAKQELDKLIRELRGEGYGQ